MSEEEKKKCSGCKKYLKLTDMTYKPNGECYKSCRGCRKKSGAKLQEEPPKLEEKIVKLDIPKNLTEEPKKEIEPNKEWMSLTRKPNEIDDRVLYGLAGAFCASILYTTMI